MFAWIFKKKPQDQNLSSCDEVTVPSDFLMPLTAKDLLATPRRKKLLAHIWQRTSLSRAQFDTLYLKPIERYAELVQQFPASEAHHHAYAGGMLDHGLEIMAYALKLRQSYLLPIGSTPEAQAAQAESWTACAAYAALLHDIGKIAVDLYVEYENGDVWHPWHGAVVKPYRFKYQAHREYRLHNASTGLLYHQVLDACILDWLSPIPDLWAALLYVLAGQFEYAGALGEIVTKADQASVAQELGGDPAKAMTAPKHALQRKLLDGLRYLVKEELKLNNAGPSDGWLTDEALWLVSKTVSDKLRAHLLSQGVSGIPSKNSAIFDVMQEHGLLLPTPEQRAIWSATVNSNSGWSNTFTFLKISPALIWDAGASPDAFNGSVIVNVVTEKTVADEQSNTVAVIQMQATEHTLLTTTATEPEKFDSLDAVFNILGLEDHSPSPAAEDQPVAEEMVKQVRVPEPKTHTSSVGIVEKEPVQNHQSPPLATLQPLTLVHSTIEPSGEHFLQWLKDGILHKRLIINDAQALVHTVENTIYIVTPGIFNRYVQEFPQVQGMAKEENVKEFRWVQKRFEKLRVHKKHLSGLNIWSCIVKGPRKTRRLNGYLLLDPTDIIPEVSFNNPYLELQEEQS